jgi:hypothetical protein
LLHSAHFQAGPVGHFPRMRTVIHSNSPGLFL